MDGWSPRQRIEVANGQLWQAAGESSGVVRPGTAKVRGMLGMEFENIDKTALVRRVE